MQILKKGFSIFAAVCLLLAVMPGQTVRADETTDENGFTVDDSGTLVAYSGAGGAITIPESVSTIASGVFASNTSITSVTIPSYVTGMGSAVFYNCTSLGSVSIEGDIGSIPAETFYNCTSLISVSIGTSISSIGSQAFAECSSLSQFTIPESVGSIGDKAFYDCTSLTGITIPAGVSSIGSNVFTGCSRLASISVASGNGTYASSDGCLYNKAMTRLIRCPEGKSGAKIATSTVTIGAGAFANCKSVTSLTVPDSVNTIETDAFSGSSISTILIPASVTSIGSQSSWSPSTISGYSGTQAQVYATGNGISFQSLGGETQQEQKNPQNQQNQQNPGTSGTSENKGNTSQAGSGSATTVTGGGTAVTGGNVIGATKNSNSGKTVTSGSHEKDSTPKTGDGINPVFFLCIGVLLVGVYFVVSNRKKAA